MTEQRTSSRSFNEPFEPRRARHEFDNDRSQGREPYERQAGERSSVPRHGDDSDRFRGDDLARHGSSSTSGNGWQGRDNLREAGERGQQQPYSSQGDGASAFSTSGNHGPHSGKGPKGYKRSDLQICDEANQALERDGRVDASEIEVTCVSGVLKLTGKVENRAAKRDAEACVESIYGVGDVMNELKVENGFFADLFGTGSNPDRGDRKGASGSSQNNS